MQHGTETFGTNTRELSAVTLCGEGTQARRALVLSLQRVTACGTADARNVSPLADNGPLTVLLTKFHQGTADTGHTFDVHLCCTAWDKMLRIVRNSPKWIIAGALATHEMSVFRRLKEQQCDLDVSRIISEVKAITCLILGLTPSTCENHCMEHMVIIDVPQGTVQPRAQRVWPCTRSSRVSVR